MMTSFVFIIFTGAFYKLSRVGKTIPQINKQTYIYTYTEIQKAVANIKMEPHISPYVFHSAHGVYKQGIWLVRGRQVGR